MNIMMSNWPRSEEQLPSPPLPQGPAVESALPPAPSSSVNDKIQVDFSHFTTTVAGILMLVEFVFGIICLACASPALHPGTGFFLFVAGIAFAITFIWIIIYLFSINEAARNVNWNATEMVCFGLIAVLYLIAAIVQLSIWAPIPAVFSFVSANANVAAGVFGLFNCIAYSATAFLAYLANRSEPSV